MNDPGLRHRVPRIGDDAQIRSGPSLIESHRASDGRYDIVAPMYDNARYVFQSSGFEQQFAITSEKTGIDEIVALDPREGQRVGIGAKARYAVRLRNEGKRRAFPDAPARAAAKRWLRSFDVKRR